MKKRSNLILLILLTIINGCIFPSEVKVEKRIDLDSKILNEFGIDENDEIYYQLYHSYGWNQKMEQLVVIVENQPASVFAAKLPIPKAELKKLKWINIKKYLDYDTIPIRLDLEIHSDIRLKSFEYMIGNNLNVSSQVGEFMITRNDSIEMIILRDSSANRLYYESIKCKNCS